MAGFKAWEKRETGRRLIASNKGPVRFGKVMFNAKCTWGRRIGSARVPMPRMGGPCASKTEDKAITSHGGDRNE